MYRENTLGWFPEPDDVQTAQDHTNTTYQGDRSHLYLQLITQHTHVNARRTVRSGIRTHASRGDCDLKSLKMLATITFCDQSSW